MWTLYPTSRTFSTDPNTEVQFLQLYALQHDKPILYLDMGKLSVEDAANLLKGFVEDNDIEILNVAGSRKSKDDLIYEKTFQVIEGRVKS